MRVESEKYLIKAENASPSHRDIQVEFFSSSGGSLKPSDDVFAHACQNASRKEILRVVSEPLKQSSTLLTKEQVAERLVRSGADEPIAKKMVEDLEIGSLISLISGYCGRPFVAIVDRPILSESLQLPYRIRWTPIS